MEKTTLERLSLNFSMKVDSKSATGVVDLGFADKLTEEKMINADLVMIATNHSDFDYELINNNSRATLNTRNSYIPNINIERHDKH